MNDRIRGTIIVIAMSFVLVVFIARLFAIQVVSEDYGNQADRYSVKEKIIIPPRGSIFDRKGRLFVSNSPLFDLQITARELSIPDTQLLCKQLDMSHDELNQGIAKAQVNSYKEYILTRHIEPRAYTILQEQLWNFGGISYSTNNKRNYQSPIGGNVLGYLREVDPKDIKSSEGYYRMGDMIGKSGIEREYEEELRGKKGRKMILKDVRNREVGSYQKGKKDVKATIGKDLLIGLDIELQKFGEEIMQNKKGSIVAIEPSTGEILAFVSVPSYDPNMLTGREFKKNWPRLRRDTLKPLYNRPLMATYSPGSIFKIAVALSALEAGTITPYTYYGCGGGFARNRGKPGCRFHPSPLSLNNAIKYSCNAYFAATYMDLLHHKKFENIYEGYDFWYKSMAELGIGQRLHIDMPSEKTGLLPTSDMYDNAKRWYGKNRWQATTVISNSIGQGEILMTPLQMAHLATIVANRGFYYPPHFLRATRRGGSKGWLKKPYRKKTTSIDRAHFSVVIDAMEDVVATGTAGRARIEDIRVCGKTGTVQNSHGEDHSTFIGFAPKDNPRIAIAVIIENAGGGGSWAAPTASLMIEKYLTGKIEYKKFEYERIKNADFINPRKRYYNN